MLVMLQSRSARLSKTTQSYYKQWIKRKIQPCWENVHPNCCSNLPSEHSYEYKFDNKKLIQYQPDMIKNTNLTVN